MGLNLYSKIEPYLDFQDEVYNLHNEFMSIVFDKELDNILDVGCGQGFFIESLNLNQKNAYGIDLSSEQIEACKQRGVENVACIDLKDVKEKYDGVIALGAVIRGETPHFDYVSAEVSKGVAKAGLDTEKPVIFGVLTTDTIEQAISRAGTKSGNKGYDAAVSMIEMVNLFKEIG